ncbi:hypothetical protein D3C71_994590 [compost metagenome]
MRNGVFVNMGDSAIAADEQHIERDEGVAHPHGDGARLTEIEQHAVFRRHGFTEHQTLRALGIVQRQFGNEVVRFPGSGFNGERL